MKAVDGARETVVRHPIDLADADAEVQSGGRRTWLLIVFVLTVVAAALRLYRINHDGLVFDEAFTLMFSRLPLDRVVLVGGAHEHPPLYYLLVHLGLQLRDSLMTPRIISAVAGALSVPALYALGARLFNRASGLVAAILLTLSPFHIWSSQVGRGYALAGLMVLMSYLCLVTALENPRRAMWIAYAVFTAAALYAEYTSALALLPQILFIARAREAHLTHALIGSWIGAAALFAPWLGILVHNVGRVASHYWISPPSPDALVQTILLFLGMATPCPSAPCRPIDSGMPGLAGHEYAVAVAAVVGIAALVAVAAYRRQRMLLLLGLWILLPFAIILLLSIHRSLYLDRVFLVDTYPLYLIVGFGVVRGVVDIRSARALPAIAAGVMVLGSLTAYGAVYDPTVNERGLSWKAATHDLVSAYRPGQTVVFHWGPVRTIAGIYAPGGWHPREAVIWLHRYLDVPDLEGTFGSLTDRQMLDRELSKATRGQRQVWLYTHDTDLLGNVRHWFQVHGFHLRVSEIYFAQRRVELWDRRPLYAFGRAVVPDNGFQKPWTRAEMVRISHGVADERGSSNLTRTFLIEPGTAYTVTVEYRASPGARPHVSLVTLDRSGRFLARFPRLLQYTLLADGTWRSQPFGFISPPRAQRAVITLGNRRGLSEWRRVAVYEEPTAPRTQAVTASHAAQSLKS